MRTLPALILSETGDRCAASRTGGRILCLFMTRLPRNWPGHSIWSPPLKFCEHVENGRTCWPNKQTRELFVLLSSPTGRMRSFEQGDVGHYRNFVKGEVETFVTNCGFEPRACWYGWLSLLFAALSRRLRFNPLVFEFLQRGVLRKVEEDHFADSLRSFSFLLDQTRIRRPILRSLCETQP